MGAEVKQRVLTLMWGTAWERYGKKFCASFRKHWPRNVELMIVTDQVLPVGWATQVMLDDVPGYTSFMGRFRDDPRACGYGRNDQKATPSERYWKYDAVKWAPQALCAVAGLDGMDECDLLAWFDADVETIAPVPSSWINVLLAGNDLACLQRGLKEPEIGFWAVRVGPRTTEAIERFAGIYSSGEVFDLRWWHSGHVFGAAVQQTAGLAINNLNSKEARGHVWQHTALAPFTRHLKGKRKDK